LSRQRVPSARQPRRRRIPVALTIAGSDSGGGAGVQADLKTFAAFNVHGVCALTCVTAQNPGRVLRIQPCAPRLVREQIEAVLDELPPAAAKTGMLCNEGIIRELIRLFRDRARMPLVVDPVMISTSGTRLLRASAVKLLVNGLFPLAAMVTPNLREAEVITGRVLRSPEDLRWAARQIHRRCGCAVLLKGGHLRGREAADIFFDGRTELLLTAPFVKGVRTHGTGCTLSAAVTALLASGHALPDAVCQAKSYVAGAIAAARCAASHPVLNHFFQFPSLLTTASYRATRP
jgi:hydroxymethylpyrimidine/phosphomethylpyrimidine kinase